MCMFTLIGVILWQSGGAGPEASDAVAKNKVTIITAVAKKTEERSVEAKRGELMESNIDAMEVLSVLLCVCVCLSVCLCVLLCVCVSVGLVCSIYVNVEPIIVISAHPVQAPRPNAS